MKILRPVPCYLPASVLRHHTAVRGVDGLQFPIEVLDARGVAGDAELAAFEQLAAGGVLNQAHLPGLLWEIKEIVGISPRPEGLPGHKRTEFWGQNGTSRYLSPRAISLLRLWSFSCRGTLQRAAKGWFLVKLGGGE